MTLTYVEGTVTGPTGEEATLDFLVDSGAHYTLLPGEAWRRLGLLRKRTIRLRLADGTLIERGVAQCDIRLSLGETATPVVMGEDTDVALLGVVTLETAVLSDDPREPVGVRFQIAGAASPVG